MDVNFRLPREFTKLVPRKRSIASCSPCKIHKKQDFNYNFASIIISIGIFNVRNISIHIHH